MKIGVFLVCALTLFACKTYSEEDKKNFDAQIKNYLKEKNISCERSESGLYYQIIEPGEGENIQYLDSVTFTYKGTFLDGNNFYSPKEPVTYAVKDLIGAWKEIMLELKPGAKAFLVAPPHLGYGDRKLDDIPENSILVFEMEIHAVK